MAMEKLHRAGEGHFVFRELTRPEMARAGEYGTKIWYLRRAGVNRRQIAAEMGTSIEAVGMACVRLRRLFHIDSGRAPCSPPGIDRTMSDREFEARCRADSAWEHAHRGRLAGLGDGDWDPCLSCGLRGHTAEACDLPLRRGCIAEGRDVRDEMGEP